MLSLFLHVFKQIPMIRYLGYFSNISKYNKIWIESEEWPLKKTKKLGVVVHVGHGNM